MSASTESTRPTRLSLSAAQQGFLTFCQRLRYGCIPLLQIANGQPVLADLRGIRLVKVLGENDPHPASRWDDYALRQEVVAFFRLLAGLGDGEIRNLEVKNGLPFTFEVDEVLSD